MSSEQVLFIQHNRNSGKISSDDAIKVWTHVSRSCWRDKLSRKTVLGQKPLGSTDNYKIYTHCSSHNTADCSCHRSQQSFLPKLCLHHVESPEDLLVCEFAYSTIFDVNLRSISAHFPNTIRSGGNEDFNQAMVNLNAFSVTTQFGVHDLENQKILQAFAMFDLEFIPRAECNVSYSTGRLPVGWQDRCIHKCRCEIGIEYSFQEIEYEYDKLLKIYEEIGPGDLDLFDYQFLTLGMAKFYLRHRDFTPAAMLLSNALQYLEDYVAKGYKCTIPCIAPVSGHGIVQRLCVLAQTQTLQEVFIRSLQHYSRFLSAQGQIAEAQKIETEVDQHLAAYMLFASNSVSYG